MKWRPSLLLVTLLVAGAASTRGDETSDPSQQSASATYDSFDTPLAVSNPQAAGILTADQQAAQLDAQVKEQANRGWLEKSYSQQMRAYHESSDRYSNMANDPELAKLAGLPAPDGGSAGTSPAATTRATTDNSSLRVLKDAPASDDQSALFQPLISPLSDSATTDVQTLSPADTARTAPTAAQMQAENTSAMDVPGLTAAEKGLPPTDSLKLALDPDDGTLPSEMTGKSSPGEAAKFSLRALPVASTDDLLKAQQAQLQAPGSVVAVAKAKTEQPTPVADDEDKMIAPASSGLRSQIADPRDYLFR